MITEVLPLSKRTNKELYSFKDLKQYIQTKLIEQGKQSIDRMMCQYKSIDGSKCAIGHIIPDELYNPDMEGNCTSLKDIIYSCPDLIKEMQFSLFCFRPWEFIRITTCFLRWRLRVFSFYFSSEKFS